MAKIKQFKIARRLGSPIFSKCDNPKFSITKKTYGKRGFRQQSEYGLQLLEKQKVRYIYGLREKQFSNYIKSAMTKKGVKVTDELFKLLELRLDNVVYRLGLAKTRRFARQIVSHGHILVNGRKVTIPSYSVKKGDVLGVRKGSEDKVLFLNLSERLKDYKTPNWLVFNEKKKEGKIEGEPKISDDSGLVFDLTSVIEFYSR